ncbi:MAG: phosphotransferase [Pseudomonadota bacterium]
MTKGLYQNPFIQTLHQGVENLLPEWGLSGDTDLSLLCISENATFLARDPQRENPLVIRVHRPGYHTRAEIESELAWIASLRENDTVITPAFVATQNGDSITGFALGDEQRPVVAFEHIRGGQPDESGDLSDGFFQLGRITARLHQHARQWQRPDGFVRKIWNFETTVGATPHWGDWREAMGLQEDGKFLLERCTEVLKTQLADYGSTPDRFGLMHADLRLTNLLADADQLAVIDFDDCGFSWFMYDFAAAISFIETSPQIPALQTAWLEGYQQVATLSPAEIASLPMFITLRRLLLTAWLASHCETPTAQELGSDYTDGTLAIADNFLSNTQAA